MALPYCTVQQAEKIAKKYAGTQPGPTPTPTGKVVEIDCTDLDNVFFTFAGKEQISSESSSADMFVISMSLDFDPVETRNDFLALCLSKFDWGEDIAEFRLKNIKAELPSYFGKGPFGRIDVEYKNVQKIAVRDENGEIVTCQYFADNSANVWMPTFSGYNSAQFFDFPHGIAIFKLEGETVILCSCSLFFGN